MNYKKLVIQSLVIIAIILITIASFVIYIDPYQQYGYKKGYIKKTRLENPGIAKWHDYNAVITGSSMSMSHYPSQVDSIFGWNTIKVPVEGCVVHDLEILLPFIIKQGKVKNIILDFNYFTFALPPIKLELYLYDDCILNDFEYWFNLTTLKNCKIKIFNNKDISMDSLYHFKDKYGREKVTKIYRNSTDKYFKSYNYDFEKMIQLFYNKIFPLFKKNDKINFYIYFPPYSIYEFKLLEKYGFFNNILRFKKNICEKLLELHNVKLYDFQSDSSYICDLDEYIDLRHHSPFFNKRIIEDIYHDTHRVTKENYLEMINELERLTIGYEVE